MDIKKTGGDQEIQPIPTRRKPVGLVIGIIVLLIVVSVLVYQFVKKQQLADQLAEQKADLTEQFLNLRDDYSLLQTENDSMNLLVVNKQLEIGNLIKDLNKTKARNRSLIREYKKELNTLREVLRSYIVQVDSLNTKNKELIAENLKIKTEMAKEQNRREELEELRTNLEEQMEKAVVLTADEILAEGLNSRSKSVRKIKKVEKIRTCFVIRSNAVAKPGKKMVYIRILRPDGILLAFSEESIFEADGKQMVYSEKREVEYLNEDVEMCIYWDNNGDLIKGENTIELYTGGHKIGETKLFLK